ncbi:MAG: hypothetical protein AAF607_10125 [Pseudomonadota bacterium]
MAVGSTTAAIVGGAGALAGGAATVISGNRAADAQVAAADRAAEVQEYMFNTTREDLAPFRTVGEQALLQLADLYGVRRPVDEPAQPQVTNAIPGGIEFPGGVPRGFNLQQVYNQPAEPTQQLTEAGTFETSPGYEFRRDEGIKAVERSAASRGLLNSGRAVKAVQRFGDGLAADEFNNYANRLATFAGLGQTAGAQTGQFGAAAARGIANTELASGAARASSYQNTGGAINSTIENLLTLLET